MMRLVASCSIGNIRRQRLHPHKKSSLVSSSKPLSRRLPTCAGERRAGNLHVTWEHCGRKWFSPWGMSTLGWSWSAKRRDMMRSDSENLLSGRPVKSSMKSSVPWDSHAKCVYHQYLQIPTCNGRQPRHGQSCPDVGGDCCLFAHCAGRAARYPSRLYRVSGSNCGARFAGATGQCEQLARHVVGARRRSCSRNLSSQLFVAE